jgi:UMF1 family MFS transporter
MPTNDRREIFGWAMYDWANSGFQATVITVMSGPYLTALAQRDVGDNGVIFSAGPILVTAKSFFPFCIGLSVFLQVVLLPILGALADYANLKKGLMAAFCYTGSAATCLLFFVTGGRYLFGGALLVIANLCFGASLVLYNAFLNDIAT